jgi:Tol biopolymer transport system component
VRLSPDGSRIAWVAAPYGAKGEHDESAIWMAAVDGIEMGRRWTYGGADTSPRWSPDGTRLAFLSDRAKRGTAGLYVMPAVVARQSR